MTSFIRDVLLFISVAIIMTAMFTFTNCGEEGSFDSLDESDGNFVYVSYTDNSGVEHVRQAEFAEADGDVYIDGDVLIGSADDISIGQIVKLNNAIRKDAPFNQNDSDKFNALKSHKALLWPKGEVPYVVHEGVSVENNFELVNLIDQFNDLMEENNIKLRLVERESQPDYIHFIEMGYDFPMGGQSYIGRIGGGQALKVRTDNFSKTIVHHELLHALGFKHEHQRSDRHIIIETENIESSLKYNFTMYNSGASIGKYDIDSIMHYHSFAFSKNGEPTMRAQDGRIINRNRKLSQGDLYSLKLVYGSSQQLPDGIYTSKSKTYKITNGRYCQLRVNSSDSKLNNMSLTELNTMMSHGLVQGLTQKPYCN